MNINHKPLLILVTILALQLSACATAPNSSVGLYSSQPGSEIKGSYSQSKQSFIVRHDLIDVKYAVKKALQLEGIIFDEETSNMISGLAYLPQVGFNCQPVQSFAIYYSPASNNESIRLTVVADHVSFCASGKPNERQLVVKLSSSINRILASYE